jgi:hypothetical protein
MSFFPHMCELLCELCNQCSLDLCVFDKAHVSYGCIWRIFALKCSKTYYACVWMNKGHESHQRKDAYTLLIFVFMRFQYRHC